MDCTLVVGLGNPGTAYRETRHNIGFSVLDELCARWKCSLREAKGDYFYAVVRRTEQQLILIAPATYMNNSGVAVKDALDVYGVDLESCLVVADDFSLPLGTLRLRKGGSDGGHNGLYSIVYHLNSDAFPRLRCGIGVPEMPAGEETASFVLSPFGEGEREAAGMMVRRAADAVESFTQIGIDRTMNFYNKAP